MEKPRCITSGDVLADREVVVQVVEGGAAIASAIRRSLKMVVELRVNPPASSKELFVQFTDDCDPFVLYTCVVHEDDYYTLRQRQGLLIDFNAFPLKFVELVNSCIKENEKESPKFLLVLRCSGDSGGNATLEIVEVNIFKHLCHLALNLSPASTQLKLTYLADCCKKLKAEIASKERKAAETESFLQQQLHHKQEILDKTSKEVQQLRTDISQQVALSSEKQAQLITQENEKLLKVQSDADRKADRERRDLEARMHHRIEQLQTKLSSVTSQNRDLSEMRYRLESNIKELRGKLNSSEGDLDRCRQELTHTKKQNARLDHENHVKSTAARELESRVSHLERELQNQETSLVQAQQKVETLLQQKENLEKVSEERRQKLAKRENSIQLLYAELQKSLEVIKKLQKRVKEEHMTSKVRGAALVEQDKVVTEKDSRISQLSEQLQLVTTKLSQITLDKENLQQQLQDTTEKLREQEMTLHTNENVISWLNKQLNEAEMAGAVAKRAPLTEAYLNSQKLSTHGLTQQGSRLTTGGLPGMMAHSTPLSNTPGSLPTINGGWSGSAQTSVGSIRNFGSIQPIPEEISPQSSLVSPANKKSPTEKENVGGLNPKYLEAANPPVVPVRGLLQANYRRASSPESDPKRIFKDSKSRGNRGIVDVTRGGRDGRRATGRGDKKELETQRKKPGVLTKHTSNYFP